MEFKEAKDLIAKRLHLHQVISKIKVYCVGSTIALGIKVPRDYWSQNNQYYIPFEMPTAVILAALRADLDDLEYKIKQLGITLEEES